MTYAGNRVLNANNSVAIVLVIIGTVLYFEQAEDNFLFFIIPVALLITGMEAFYFELTENELIIKNYLMPFVNIHYTLSEVTQIQFLNSGPKSTADARVKIIRGDKRSIPYPGASLKTKDWEEFVDELCRKGVAVEIQAIILKSKIGILED